MDRYPDLDPDAGELVTEELVVTDDVLVKAFALGPGAELSPHDHPDATNVFHVVEGEVVVLQDEHGARNDTEQVAVLTASLCPLPGSG